MTSEAATLPPANPTPEAFSTIARRALWANNAGLVQLLGLCPLLAVSTTLVNALGLGIATLAVLTVTNLLVSLSRKLLHRDVRIPIFVLIIATLVTVVEMFMAAFFYDLYRILGIFIPLIITNCAIIGRAEAFACKQDPLRATLDGFATGLGFMAVLLAMGAIRELIGHGSLLAGLDMLLGEAASSFSLTLSADGSGFLLIALPPGAFLCLGFLIAMRNWQGAVQSEQRMPLLHGPGIAAGR